MSPQPNWPGTAGFPALPYRGAWTEKSVQLPFATGNGESASTTPKVFWGTGVPNGVVTAKPGDSFHATDTGATWYKQTGTGNTGWVLAGNVFDVRAYGAVGDGVTDDRAAFVATAAAIAAAGGGIAYIPAGTFAVGGNTVLWPSNTIVRGAGRGSTTIKRIGLSDSTPANLGAAFGTGSSDGTFYTVGSHGSFVVFEDLKIDGNYSGNSGVTSTTPHCDGIRADYTDYIVVRNVYVTNCLNSGFYFYGCRRSRWESVVSYSNGHLAAASSRNGFSISGPSDDATDQGAQDEHIFIGCEAISNTDEGFAIGRNGRIVINGCISQSNGDMGIEGDSGTATSDTTSVPEGWIVTGCHVFGNTNHGIGISNANVQRIVITSNVIETHGKSGITIAQTSGALCLISHNLVKDYASLAGSNHGIVVGAGFDKVSIIGNQVLDAGSASTAAGIVLLAQASARYIEIVGNLQSNARSHGLSITGTMTGVIAANTFANNNASSFFNGMDLVGGASADTDTVLIAHNLFLNNSQYGARIRTTSTANIKNVRFIGNVCADNQGSPTQSYGLVTTETGGGTITGAVLSGNDFSGNTTGAVSWGASASPTGSGPMPRPATLTDAATIAVDASKGGPLTVTLGGNRTVGAPTNPVQGQRLAFVIIQDGTGGRTLLWNAVFKVTWSDTGNTLGKRSTIAFIYDGTNWNQDGAQSPYV